MLEIPIGPEFDLGLRKVDSVPVALAIGMLAICFGMPEFRVLQSIADFPESFRFVKTDDAADMLRFPKPALFPD